MFTNYFKMKNLPFAERMPLTQIMKDERISQGLARLQYLASQGTIALLTGQTGVGKSTLIKLFLSLLPQNHFLPIYIYFTNLRASSLFNLIVNELGEVSKRTKERMFLQIRDKIRKSNLTILLIFDEAHLLNSDAITDLRLLVSSALEEVLPLKIILSGQEEIKNTLKRSSLTDFAQRISVAYQLKSLTKAQTQAYIDFQINYSGACEKIFPAETKEMIHEYANGIPRQINNIATACMINASIQKIQIINHEVLTQTMAEFQLF